MLRTTITPLTSKGYNKNCECLGALSHFNEATTELPEEKRVSGLKVISLIHLLKVIIKINDWQGKKRHSRLLTEQTSSYDSKCAAIKSSVKTPNTPYNSVHLPITSLCCQQPQLPLHLARVSFCLAVWPFCLEFTDLFKFTLTWEMHSWQNK